MFTSVKTRGSLLLEQINSGGGGVDVGCQLSRVETMNNGIAMATENSVVDLSQYRSFCFRGEGRCNFVISAKEAAGENIRIVWRLAKHRKSNTISPKPKCRVVNAYLEQLIAPFLSEAYLIKASVVHIPAEKLHHLAKLPALPHNLKLERWEELRDENKYPRSISFFPIVAPTDGVTEVPKLVCALEMPDATRIPRELIPSHNAVIGPTITVEIKPKQGFYQAHPGFEVPYCQNCVLQIEKWRSAAFERMYDFCPLELYSGNKDRMKTALKSLIRDPHRNLRIFVDGDVVHDELALLTTEELGALLFPTFPVGSAYSNTDTLTSIVACILAGVEDESAVDFGLQEDSVLADLLRAQQIDSIGIVQAYEYYRTLPTNLQQELKNKSNLVNRKRGLRFLQRSDPRSLLERYLLAATMKDCSLMISFRLIDVKAAGGEENVREEKVIRDTSSDHDTAKGTCGYPPTMLKAKTVRVRTAHGSLHFVYSIRIVDLDPKTAKNLESAHRRFIAGVKMIRANPRLHRPCRA